jgi:hypothetical protein
MPKPRTPIDDVMAREFAETLITDELDGGLPADAPGGARAIAKTVVDEFRYAEFETVVSKVGGDELRMRRLVLTTQWEVDRSAPTA